LSVTAVIAQIVRDLRHGVRAIARAPGLAAVIAGSLAVGVGANATVFSWIQARLLAPIPGVARGADFHLIEPRNENGGFPGASWREYRDVAAATNTFDRVIAFRLAPLNVGAADWSERTFAMLVSGNYFRALGLAPVTGGLFTDADTSTPGGPALVVISHRFWQSRLAGAPNVVGQPIRLNTQVFTIAGVAPPGFQGTVMGLNFDLWVPATAAPLLMPGTNELENRASRGYLMMGALARGRSLAEGRDDVARIMSELATRHPDTNRTLTAAVLPQWQSPRGPQQSITAALAMLQALTLLVLAAVVGNTTTLVLARATSRQREAAIRLALGAARWRIVSLVLSEYVVMGAIGAALGALLAAWGTDALRAVPMPSPAGLEVSFVTGIDALTLAFAMALGLVAGIAIGLPAAWQLSRPRPQAVLRSGGAVAGRHRLRDALVALEVALAMVVLVVSAMFVRNFSRTQTADPGFRLEGVLLAAYDLNGRGPETTTAAAREFAARLLPRVQALTGVAGAALATSVPLDIHGLPARRFTLEGRAREDGAQDEALANVVSAEYFDALDIRLVRGTTFARVDDAASPPQVIVNEEFANSLGGGADVVGRRIEAGRRSYVITGVAENTLANSFGEAPSPFIYFNLRDLPSPAVELHVRAREGTDARAEALAADVRRAVRELDATLALYNVRTLSAHVDRNLFFQRIPARLFSVLGPLVLALVALGIYAVGSHAVGERRAEIGTRLALGATSGQVIRLMVVDAFRVVGLGLAGGAFVALLIDPKALSGSFSEGLLVTGVAVLFGLVALAASYVPARRAGNVDPNLTLRAE
jgi:predicted permease